jgi:DNA/RNA-binding domain of Phe-tRNA-synthetase-like protein
MFEISVSSEFKSKWPSVILGCLDCSIVMEKHNKKLWDNIETTCNEISTQIKVEDINKITAIETTRKAYRAFGKDPARYRPSAESLIRRVVKGEGLYHVNNVVDTVNLVSLVTGFSIGGYDFDKIKFPVTLRIGKHDDIYEGIGTGEMNIESLPVLSDLAGAFGCPTRDSVRTSISDKTERFLMIIFGFGDHEKIPAALHYAEKILTENASATKIKNIFIGN